MTDNGEPFSWDYSRVAYAIYKGNSVIIAHPGQQDHTFTRTAHWWRFPSDAYLPTLFKNLNLSLIPELLPKNQPKLL